MSAQADPSPAGDVSAGAGVAGAHAHEALAVVLGVRGERLSVLLWKRAQPPERDRWSLPGGLLGGDETLDASVARHLAEKVDVAELSHLEQLETRSEPGRHPSGRRLATVYLGVISTAVDPHIPDDTAWQPVDELPSMAFDHESLVSAGCSRLRSKLSYTNIGFALAPPVFTIAALRTIYSAALGYEVGATNLSRVLLRREVIEPTGEIAPPGPGGGRPAAVFRFRQHELVVTDPFAVLAPPG